MRRASAALARASRCRAGRTLVLVLAVGVAVANAERLPALDVEPLLFALLPWVLGKYVLCPLRWHGISVSGRSRRWHLRVYAESELLGLLTPRHAGADLWRAHRLHLVGLDRPTALADVALDRLLGASSLAVSVVLAGAILPLQVALAAVAVAAVVLVAALVLRRRRPEVFARRPLPPARDLTRGLALSIGYQLTIVGLLLGGLRATGHTVAPLPLLGVFGASQVAGIVPGVHGAGPREGALGAVSVVALAAWGPALLLGGGCLLARQLSLRLEGLALPAA